MKSKIITLLLSILCLIFILNFIYRVVANMYKTSIQQDEEIEITYPDATHQLEVDILLPISDVMSISTDMDGSFFILGNESLLIYSDNKILLNEINLPNKPQIIKYIDGMGLIVSYDDQVELFDKSGAFIETIWYLDRPSQITSLEVVESYLFLLDVLNKRVIRIDLKSKKEKSFYRYEGKRFIIPSPHFDIIKGLGNTIWITDPGRHKVIQFDTDLNLLSSFGEGAFTLEGFVGCCNPSNITMTSEGNIITTEKGEKRVKIYSYSGKYLGLIERLNTKNRDITDLLIDKNGYIHMLVGSNWRVYSEKDK